MPIILNSPYDTKCWVCELMKKDIKKGKYHGISCYDKLLNGTSYYVEAMSRFCCRCGAELMTETEYKEAWAKRYPETAGQLFAISSEIATEELIIALDNAQKAYFNHDEKEDDS